MGGQALKNTFTRRYAREEYRLLQDEVLRQLRRDFPQRFCEAIPAYRSKASFGDLDIILDHSALPMELERYLQQCFQPNELVRNSSVYSFDYQQFQIDIIGLPREECEIALHYFSWNDLGNIVGRLFHKMGFKYGHNGLYFIFKEANYQFTEICFSRDINKILAFADLDPERFLAGFDTIEDIFHYVASSKYFNKAIYLLENRNNASRIRDRKRPTYRALLQWLAECDDLNAYAWPSVREQDGRQYNEQFMQLALAYFPEAEPKLAQAQADFAQWKLVRQKFNGRLIEEWSGLTRQALGQFMRQLKQQGRQEFSDFEQWIAETPLSDIEEWVKGIKAHHSNK